MRTLAFLLLLLFTFSSWHSVNTWEYKVKRGFPAMPRPANYTITERGILLGSLLFNDTKLSLNQELSCASCHKQQYAFADNVNFSKGINNNIQQINTMPLFNLAWYKRFFWDGRINSIEAQIAHPIHNPTEMGANWKLVLNRINQSEHYKKMSSEIFGRSAIDSEIVVNSIAQYLRSLISDKSKFDSVLENKTIFTADEYEGYELVNNQAYAGACLNCHLTEGNTLGTNGGLAHNGLPGLAKAMRIPSLRNLKFTAPYMHDGRFKTLEEVLDFYSSNVQAHPLLDNRILPNKGKEVFTKDEKRKIIAFLNTLNDYEFVN
jgi:cytochrome c peroxidase